MTRAGSLATLDALAEAADAAVAAAGGGVEQLFQIGPQRVRLRFAGPPALERLAIPLSHLRTAAPSHSSLLITVCDGSWCGVSLPPGPWVRGSEGERGAVRGVAVDGAGFFIHHDGAVTAFSVELDSGWFWVTALSRHAQPPLLYPLSPIFSAALAPHDTYLVPAAAVGSEHGCVLVVGASGSGKSHVMQACVQAGMQYLGDDASLIECGEPTVVHSIYCTTHASPLTLELMPSLAPLIADTLKPPGCEHVTILHHERDPTSLLKEAPLRAVAIAQRRPDEQTQLCPATYGEALAALAPSAIRNAPGAGQPMLSALARAVQSTPAVRLEWGREPAGVAAAVETLL